MDRDSFHVCTNMFFEQKNFKVEKHLHTKAEVLQLATTLQL